MAQGIYIPDRKCDRCNGNIDPESRHIRATLTRDGKCFEARWCETCATVLWDQMADLSTFNEVQQEASMAAFDRALAAINAQNHADPPRPGTERVVVPVTVLQAAREDVLMHGDGCHGEVQNSRCIKCGIAPSMQDTYFR